MNQMDTTGTYSYKGWRRLWIATLLGLLTAFGPLSIDMYLPSLPSLAADLHTSASLAQLSLTACLIGLAVGQVIAGPLSDIRGRRMPLTVALATYTVASLLAAISPSIWLLIVLRFLQGIAGAAGIVISRAVSRDLYTGSELTKFLSLLMLVNGVAPIAAPIAGGQLLNVTDWHGVFIVLAAIGAMMFLGVFFNLPETLSKGSRAQGGVKETLATFQQFIGNRVFVGYALAQGFVMAGMFAYISGSPFVLQNIFGVSPQMFSVIFAINGLGIIVATQVTGKLADKVGERRLLLTGVSFAAAGGLVLLGMILAGAGLIAVLIPLFFVVASVGMVNTTSFSLAMQNQAKSAGSASALLGIMPFVMGAIVAPLVGIAGSHTAVPMGVIIAIADVGAIVSYLLLTRKKSPGHVASK